MFKEPQQLAVCKLSLEFTSEISGTWGGSAGSSLTEEEGSVAQGRLPSA